jgi:hypothetical protein
LPLRSPVPGAVCLAALAQLCERGRLDRAELVAGCRRRMRAGIVRRPSWRSSIRARIPVLAEVAARDGGSRLVTEARRLARTLAG